MKPKYKNSIPVSVILLAILLYSCEKKNTDPLPLDPVPIEISSIQKSIVDSDNKFSFDIFNLIFDYENNKGAESENIMISPLSISYALSMTLNGANGATRDSMMNALRFSGLSIDDINSSYKDLSNKISKIDKRVIMNIVNSVWCEERLNVKQGFIDALEEFYAAETFDFNVSDPDVINKMNLWIENNTNGLIKEMIKELPPDVAMVLINAIYFNGKWKHKFDKSETSDMSFFSSYSGEVSVPMMNQTTTLKVGSGTGFLLAELPYGQGNFVMDIILPDVENTLENVLQGLNSEGWNSLIESINEREVNIFMPRFKYGYNLGLKDILCSMGMSIAFNPGLADFSNISEQALFISKVLHQSFIDNNEEGTEAAAATVVIMEFTSAPPEPMIIKLDRPFFYIIRESSTNTILFMGITGNPAKD